MNIFKKIAWQIREWRYLRECNTIAEFEAYCKVLKTPDKLNDWIAQIVAYDSNEIPLRWRTLEQVLSERSKDPELKGWKFGNCTELAVVARHGLRAMGYKSDIVCVYGEDGTGKKTGHAFACYSSPTLRGVVNCPRHKTYPVTKNWIPIILAEVPDWKVTCHNWSDDKGKKILSVI